MVNGMARRLLRSRMMTGGIAYLKERYPGIVDDCVEYRHERQADGLEYLILKVLVHDDEQGQDPFAVTHSDVAEGAESASNRGAK